MQIIPNENLSSQVDGVNKVFTVANPILQIMQLNFDWAEYFDYTITSSTEITLVDAPVSFLYIDYTTPWIWVWWGELTVIDCKNLLASRKKDISDVSSDVFLNWLNELQETVYPYLYNNQDKYIASQSISVVAWTSNYTIPNWNREPLWTGVYLDWEWYDEDNYKIIWDNLILTTQPTTNFILEYKYVPELPDLTEINDDVTIFNTSMKKLVTEWLDELYSTWDEDWLNESNASQRFIRELDKLPTMDNADLPVINNY